MEKRVKYPIGEQNFKNIRDNELLYVDKTRYIDKLINSGSRYYFLARPRRFGKSLFLSTLRYFFEGQRHLFKGLYIDSTDWKWEEYPVLYLDLNRERYAEKGNLNEVLDVIFHEWEEKYEIEVTVTNLPQRFQAIIKAAYEKTGRQVVILVDEYDKPLVGNINKEEHFEQYRSQLAAIYSNFKSSAEYIKFVFLTGVSRFSRLSIFSDLNNLNDITFDEEFADMCGITADELEEKCKEGIVKLADKLELTYEEAKRELKNSYDGYRFTKKESEIYNPWSLLNCLDKSDIDFFWNETGLPTIIAESLKRINADLEKLFDNTLCSEQELKGMDLTNPQPVALMFQTGYLTIKEYNRKVKRYLLGVPNNEVKSGLFNFLLPYYVKSKRVSVNSVINDMMAAFMLGRPDEAMKSIQTYFAGIDYALKMENENNFHNAFFLLMDIIGLETYAESHTSEGRIDIEVKTEDYIYIIELKYDHSPEEALHQIEDKHYVRKYQSDCREVFLIGVEFSSKTRCVERWIIRKEDKTIERFCRR